MIEDQSLEKTTSRHILNRIYLPFRLWDDHPCSTFTQHTLRRIGASGWTSDVCLLTHAIYFLAYVGKTQ